MLRANRVGDSWEEVRAELERAFEASRSAAQEGRSFVYLIHQDDLLGRRGPGNAMVAAGLLSAARTAALEGAARGWTANVVAVGDQADPGEVDRLTAFLLESPAVTGELVRVGPDHIGKALP